MGKSKYLAMDEQPTLPADVRVLLSPMVQAYVACPEEEMNEVADESH